MFLISSCISNKNYKKKFYIFYSKIGVIWLVRTGHGNEIVKNKILIWL